MLEWTFYELSLAMSFPCLRLFNGFPLHLGRKTYIIAISYWALHDLAHTYFSSLTLLSITKEALTSLSTFQSLENIKMFPTLQTFLHIAFSAEVNIHLGNPNILAEVRLNVFFSNLN